LDNAKIGTTGSWWFSNAVLASNTGCTQAKPCTWAEVLASPALDNPTINAAAPGVGFKVGSNWNAVYTGNVDAFKIGVNSNTTVYDFESVNLPTSKEDCMKDGYKNVTDAAGDTFKNQGLCISYMNKPKVSNYTLSSASQEGINVPTTEGYKYKVTVSGTWTNRGVEQVDAECTSYDGGAWANAVTGGYSSDLLDVQINQAFVNWGDCNDDSHTYTRWVTGDGDPVNLRVFDGDVSTNQQNASWFGDNQGSLDVKVTAYPKH
jgi:hypothetical protein